MSSRFSWAGFRAIAASCALALMVIVAFAPGARAQGFSINRFDPAEHGSNWFSGESLDLRGSVRPSLGLTLDWAYKPLVIYDQNGDGVIDAAEAQLRAMANSIYSSINDQGGI